LADTTIEYFENAGITTTVYNYFTKSAKYKGLDWVWLPDTLDETASTTNISFLTRNTLTYAAAAGVWYFSTCVPLKSIFNCCNDYNKVIKGLKQKIRMTRATATRTLFRTNNLPIAANGVFSLKQLLM